jgi:hypothetical protein
MPSFPTVIPKPQYDQYKDEQEKKKSMPFFNLPNFVNTAMDKARQAQEEQQRLQQEEQQRWQQEQLQQQQDLQQQQMQTQQAAMMPQAEPEPQPQMQPSPTAMPQFGNPFPQQPIEDVSMPVNLWEEARNKSLQRQTEQQVFPMAQPSLPAATDQMDRNLLDITNRTQPEPIQQAMAKLREAIGVKDNGELLSEMEWYQTHLNTTEDKFKEMQAAGRAYRELEQTANRATAPGMPIGTNPLTPEEQRGAIRDYIGRVDAPISQQLRGVMGVNEMGEQLPNLTEREELDIRNARAAEAQIKREREKEIQRQAAMQLEEMTAPARNQMTPFEGIGNEVAAQERATAPIDESAEWVGRVMLLATPFGLQDALMQPSNLLKAASFAREWSAEDQSMAVDWINSVARGKDPADFYAEYTFLGPDGKRMIDLSELKKINPRIAPVAYLDDIKDPFPGQAMAKVEALRSQTREQITGQPDSGMTDILGKYTAFMQKYPSPQSFVEQGKLSGEQRDPGDWSRIEKDFQILRNALNTQDSTQQAEILKRISPEPEPILTDSFDISKRLIDAGPANAMGEASEILGETMGLESAKGVSGLQQILGSFTDLYNIVGYMVPAGLVEASATKISKLLGTMAGDTAKVAQLERMLVSKGISPQSIPEAKGVIDQIAAMQNAAKIETTLGASKTAGKAAIADTMAYAEKELAALAKRDPAAGRVARSAYDIWVGGLGDATAPIGEDSNVVIGLSLLDIVSPFMGRLRATSKAASDFNDQRDVEATASKWTSGDFASQVMETEDPIPGVVRPTMTEITQQKGKALTPGPILVNDPRVPSLDGQNYERLAYGLGTEVEANGKSGKISAIVLDKGQFVHEITLDDGTVLSDSKGNPAYKATNDVTPLLKNSDQSWPSVVSKNEADGFYMPYMTRQESTLDPSMPAKPSEPTRLQWDVDGETKQGIVTGRKRDAQGNLVYEMTEVSDDLPRTAGGGVDFSRLYTENAVDVEGSKLRPVGATTSTSTDTQTLFQRLADSWDQSYAASGTSQRQLPATFKAVKQWVAGTVNFDLGAGKYPEILTDELKSKGVTNYPWDPFNLSEETNNASLAAIADKKADTVTVNNVLNVIKEQDVRSLTIARAADSLKPDGTAYFYIYDGNRDGVGKATGGDKWQNNMKPAEYVPEILEHFDTVTVKGRLITASEPKAAQSNANGARTPGKEIGGNTYVHKDYASQVIPAEMLDASNNAFQSAGLDWKPNAYSYNPRTRTVRLDEAPDFDTAREPRVGRYLSVTLDEQGNVSGTRQGKSDSIWHNKWMWVGDDYKGFDVAASKRWSEAWKSKMPKGTVASGSKAVWDKQLSDMGLSSPAGATDTYYAIDPNLDTPSTTPGTTTRPEWLQAIADKSPRHVVALERLLDEGGYTDEAKAAMFQVFNDEVVSASQKQGGLTANGLTNAVLNTIYVVQDRAANDPRYRKRVVHETRSSLPKFEGILSGLSPDVDALVRKGKSLPEEEASRIREIVRDVDQLARESKDGVLVKNKLQSLSNDELSAVAEMARDGYEDSKGKRTGIHYSVSDLLWDVKADRLIDEVYARTQQKVDSSPVESAQPLSSPAKQQVSAPAPETKYGIPFFGTLDHELSAYQLGVKDKAREAVYARFLKMQWEKAAARNAGKPVPPDAAAVQSRFDVIRKEHKESLDAQQAIDDQQVKDAQELEDKKAAVAERAESKKRFDDMVAELGLGDTATTPDADATTPPTIDQPVPSSTPDIRFDEKTQSYSIKGIRDTDWMESIPPDPDVPILSQIKAGLDFLEELGNPEGKYNLATPEGRASAWIDANVIVEGEGQAFLGKIVDLNDADNIKSEYVPLYAEAARAIGEDFGRFYSHSKVKTGQAFAARAESQPIKIKYQKPAPKVELTPEQVAAQDKARADAQAMLDANAAAYAERVKSPETRKLEEAAALAEEAKKKGEETPESKAAQELVDKTYKVDLEDKSRKELSSALTAIKNWREGKTPAAKQKILQANPLAADIVGKSMLAGSHSGGKYYGNREGFIREQEGAITKKLDESKKAKAPSKNYTKAVDSSLPVTPEMPLPVKDTSPLEAAHAATTRPTPATAPSVAPLTPAQQAQVVGQQALRGLALDQQQITDNRKLELSNPQVAATTRFQGQMTRTLFLQQVYDGFNITDLKQQNAVAGVLDMLANRWTSIYNATRTSRVTNDLFYSQFLGVVKGKPGDNTPGNARAAVQFINDPTNGSRRALIYSIIDGDQSAFSHELGHVIDDLYDQIAKQGDKNPKIDIAARGDNPTHNQLVVENRKGQETTLWSTLSNWSLAKTKGGKQMLKRDLSIVSPTGLASRSDIDAQRTSTGSNIIAKSVLDEASAKAKAASRPEHVWDYLPVWAQETYRREAAAEMFAAYISDPVNFGEPTGDVHGFGIHNLDPKARNGIREMLQSYAQFVRKAWATVADALGWDKVPPEAEAFFDQLFSNDLYKSQVNVYWNKPTGTVATARSFQQALKILITDRKAALADVQWAMRHILGRELYETERAYEAFSVNSGGQSLQYLKDKVQPIIRNLQRISRAYPDAAKHPFLHHNAPDAVRAVSDYRFYNRVIEIENNLDEKYRDARDANDDGKSLRKFLADFKEGAGREFLYDGDTHNGVNTFSNHLHANKISRQTAREAIDKLKAEWGPQWGAIMQENAKISGVYADLLMKLEDEGLIGSKEFDAMRTSSPEYNPIFKEEYFTGKMHGSGGNPIQAMDYGSLTPDINSMDALVRYNNMVHAQIAKNRARAAYVELINKPNSSHEYSFFAVNEGTGDVGGPPPDNFHIFVFSKEEVTNPDGSTETVSVKTTYSVPKVMQSVFEGVDTTTHPWASLLVRFTTMMMTRRNPLFLPANAILDMFTTVGVMSVRLGGPQHIPAIMYQLGKSYVSAFQGLHKGELTSKEAKEFRRVGAAQGALFAGGERNMSPGADASKPSKLITGIVGKPFWEVQSPGDILDFITGFVSLKWIEDIGERVEMAPRLAAMELTKKAGGDNLKMMMNARNVTIDFGRGGTLTKFMNGYLVPFLNASIQASTRMWGETKQNPKSMAATTALTLIAPQIAAEIWNRSDPERERDYEDALRLYGNQGIIIMLPFRGPDGKFMSILVPTREMTSVVTGVRDAMTFARTGKLDPWNTLAGVFKPVMPVQGNDVLSTLATTFSFPVVVTLVEIITNYDFYRSSKISTVDSRKNASILGRWLSSVTEWDPAFVDYFFLDVFGGPFKMFKGASDIIDGKEPAFGIPFVGGLVSRFAKVGTPGGKAFQKATEDYVNNPDVKRIRKLLGIDTSIGEPGSTDAGVAPVVGLNARAELIEEQNKQYTIRAKKAEAVFNQYKDKPDTAPSEWKWMFEDKDDMSDNWGENVTKVARNKADQEYIKSHPATSDLGAAYKKTLQLVEGKDLKDAKVFLAVKELEGVPLSPGARAALQESYNKYLPEALGYINVVMKAGDKKLASEEFAWNKLGDPNKPGSKEQAQAERIKTILDRAATYAKQDVAAHINLSRADLGFPETMPTAEGAISFLRNPLGKPSEVGQLQAQSIQTISAANHDWLRKQGMYVDISSVVTDLDGTPHITINGKQFNDTTLGDMGITNGLTKLQTDTNASVKAAIAKMAKSPPPGWNKMDGATRKEYVSSIVSAAKKRVEFEFVMDNPIRIDDELWNAQTKRMDRATYNTLMAIDNRLVVGERAKTIDGYSLSYSQQLEYQNAANAAVKEYASRWETSVMGTPTYLKFSAEERYDATQGMLDQAMAQAKFRTKVKLAPQLKESDPTTAATFGTVSENGLKILDSTGVKKVVNAAGKTFTKDGTTIELTDSEYLAYQEDVNKELERRLNAKNQFFLTPDFKKLSYERKEAIVDDIIAEARAAARTRLPRGLGNLGARVVETKRQESDLNLWR